jgi:hypothetical protein
MSSCLARGVDGDRRDGRRERREPKVLKNGAFTRAGVGWNEEDGDLILWSGGLALAVRVKSDYGRVAAAGLWLGWNRDEAFPRVGAGRRSSAA